MGSPDPVLQPFELKGLVLRNRIMSTSHAPGYAEGGLPGRTYQLYHEEKAKGGIALTMFGGSSNVAPDSASVFGGQSNLLQAINNIFTLYDPDVIAVHTTCLSETIGDDIPQIAEKAAEDGLIPPGKSVIHTNTPSYVGAHPIGFANMVKSMVDYFAAADAESKSESQINIIPGWVEPADMREVRRVCIE